VNFMRLKGRFKMNSSMRSFLPLAMLVLICCCSRPQPYGDRTATESASASRLRVAATTPKTSTMKEKSTPAISPAVAALLRPDPDLDTAITKEEIKATLEAAQRQAPPPRPELHSTGEGEWAKMEAAQKTQLDRRHEFLQQTTVYTGPDGMYHTRSCEKLIQVVYVYSSGVVVATDRRFIGHAITLEQARADHVPRHADCAPPSYD